MKKLILLFAFTLSMHNISSQEIAFEITSLVGFSFSKIDELVYSNNIKESHLEWNNCKPCLAI